MDLKGKTVSFLGDSITEGACVSDIKNNRYDNVVMRELGLGKVNNYGISGTRISHQFTPSEKARHDLNFCGRCFDMDPTSDVIVVFGGTNDSWAGAPMGEYKYENLRRDDFFSYRPALAYLLDHMQKRYPNVELVFLINSELSKDVTESTQKICDHYGVKWIQLHDIDKQSGHPSQKGMKAIAEQIAEKLRN